MIHRLPLAAILLLAGCGAEPEVVTVARKAADYLWSAQRDDGIWRSDVHGLARSGQSWTAFTLFHLLDLPDSVAAAPKSRVQRALSFIERNVQATSGSASALGLADSAALDYPVYATAYALRTFILASERGMLTPAQERLIRRMAAYLLDQQLIEPRGVQHTEPAYGGWGIGMRPSPPRAGGGRAGPAYADVAHVRRVIEALDQAAAFDPSLRPGVEYALSAVRVFLSRVQKIGLPSYDGGFYYSPTLLDLNKAGLIGTSEEESAGEPRSYATATCDGLLALLAAGNEATSEQIVSAAAYLAAHDTLSHAAGLPGSRASWREILFFYHLAGRSEVHARLISPGSWRRDVISLLHARQRPDGSFLNPYGAPNKEDDPVIATTLALSALRHSL